MLDRIQPPARGLEEIAIHTDTRDILSHATKQASIRRALMSAKEVRIALESALRAKITANACTRCDARSQSSAS
jgi:hypothetical protein